MSLIRTLVAGALALAISAQPALSQQTRHRFIVVLDDESVGLAHERAVDRQRTVNLTSRLARNISAQGGVKPKAILGHLGIFIVDATRSQAERLANLPGVRSVEEDRMAEESGPPDCFSPITFPLANSYDPVSPQTITCWDPYTSCSDSWALDRIDQRTGSQAAHTLDSKFYFGARGTGVHIYIVDTGLVATHSEFALTGGGTRVGNGTNFAITGQCPPNKPTTSCGDRPAWDTYDGNGHGTLVTSIAAGRRFGVAKSAIVHPVRVGNDGGRSWTSWIASGMDWVAANAVRPAVVNLSYNIEYSPFEDTASLDTAVQRLINNYGIPVVNSAGNRNSPVVNFSPTALPEVIVVAGIKSNNYRYGYDAPLSCTAEFCGSNYGSQVDLFAPAVDIMGAMASSGQSYLCISTGTSYSAPLVTGVVAQYLETNPTASPALVQTVLIERATTSAVLGELRGSPNRLLYTNF